MVKKISVKAETHSALVKQEATLDAKDSLKKTHNKGITDLLEKSVELSKLIPIVKRLREVTEQNKRSPNQFFNGFPRSPNAKEHLQALDDVLNELEKLGGVPVTVWGKNENGVPIRIPKKECDDND
ncbi:hypothetical protein D4R42_05480 [bacterium]|nr:MAG: hypothetical protein D4R42_05480 [bacterium]